MPKKIFFWLVFLAILAGIVVLLPKAVVKAPVATEIDALNATYLIDDTQITIKDGSYEGKIADSVATEKWSLSKEARGDVNADGLEDVAVVLYGNTGGTGTFYYVGVLVNGGELVPAVFIGDRVSIEEVAIDGGVVKLSYKDRAVDDPLASDPTIEKSVSYRFQSGKLVVSK